MNVQFIEHNGVKHYAVIPVDDYNALVERAEMRDDMAAFDEAMAADDEVIPVQIVNRLLVGENKIKVWRYHRQLTQAELAVQCGLSQALICQLESGVRVGGVRYA